MESGELTPKRLEQYFEDDLNKSSEAVQNKYNHLLLAERIKRTRENGNKPAGPVPLNIRQMILDAARVPGDLEASKNALKRERDWLSHTSKDGRPPIGGAQDD